MTLEFEFMVVKISSTMIDALQVCLTSIMTFSKLKDTKKCTGRISALGILAATRSWHQILKAGSEQNGLYVSLA